MSFDPTPDRGPRSAGERLGVGLFGLLFVGAFAAEIATRYEPAKLSIVFMLVFWVPLLALHELGHAVVARSLGWRVSALVVGFGPAWASFRWHGVHVEIRALPVEGFVRCAPRDLEGVRLRSALIYLAGPGVELGVVLAILLLASPSVLLAPSTSLSVIVLQSLALAAALGAVVNLIPHSTLSSDGEIANDGLGIVQSFRVPLAHFEAMIEPDDARP